MAVRAWFGKPWTGIFRCLWFCVSAFCIGSLSVSTLADTATQKRIHQLNAEMERLNGVLQSIQASRSKLQTQLATNEKNQGQITQKIHQNNNQLQQYKTRIKKTLARETALKKQKQQQQKYLAAALRARYIQGDENWLKLWLNQTQGADITRNLLYYHYLYQAQVQQITTYQQTLSQLKTVEKQHKQQYQQMLASQQALGAKKRALLQQQKQHRTTLASIQASWREKNKRLARIKAQKAELSKVVKAIVSMDFDLPSGQPFYRARGKLPWPVQGRLIKTFRGGKNDDLSSHGMLIAAKDGTPIRAVYHGQVVFANWLRGYGLVMIIDHGSGYLSLYAHNQSLLKAAGDWVQPGDGIGRVGRSGGQTQAALYFELRKKGKPYNPLPWLRQRK